VPMHFPRRCIFIRYIQQYKAENENENENEKRDEACSPSQQLKLGIKNKNKCHFQAHAAHLILSLSSPSNLNSLYSCPNPQPST
jgi:hypothetical protein